LVGALDEALDLRAEELLGMASGNSVGGQSDG
jgi:hypothetical protein